MNTSTRHLTKALLATVLGTALLVGCGGGGDGGSSGSSDGGGVASLQGKGSAEPSGAAAEADGDDEKDAEEQILAYTQCLREQGLDVPDPVFDEDGGSRMMVRGERAGKAISPEQFRKAQEACGEPPAPPGGGAPIDASEMQDAALEFAKCMREQGIDMPDPQFSSEGGRGAVTFGIGPGGGRVDFDDPKLQAAEEKCRPIMEDARKGDR